MRGVELDVRRAQPHQLVDLLAEDLRDVAEELLGARIGAARALGIPEVGEEARARQRDLENPFGPGPRIGELVGGEEAFAPELPLHGDRRALDPHLAELTALPLAPEKRVQVPVPETLDRLGHLALEREPPHLPVGDDVHARASSWSLRASSTAASSACLSSVASSSPFSKPVARGEQLRRPQKAADDVRARLEHGATVLRPQRYPRAWARRARAAEMVSPFRS